MAVLACHDISYSYPGGQQALEGVTLRVEPGERVALLGPNGAGKSTLLLHFNGLIEPSSGQVEVNNHPLEPGTMTAARAAVGLVFQNPDDQLFNLRVYDDVAFGPLHMGLDSAEVRQRSLAALAAVGMAGHADRVPFHLSMGQKKRVALATVLSMSPAVLVLDEPTAGLDPRGRRELIGLLDGMPQALIAATHDLAFARALFPRAVILDGGRVVYDGPTAAALDNGDLLRAHGLD